MLLLTDAHHSDDSWHLFLKRFAASVQHITGQELDVQAVKDPSGFAEREIEELRNKVEELSDEVKIKRKGAMFFPKVS